MTEEMRLQAVEILKNHFEDIRRVNMFGAIWISIAPISKTIDYSYAFFKDYMDAESWLKQQFEIKDKYCEFVHTYLNGKLFLCKDIDK